MHVFCETSLIIIVEQQPDLSEWYFIKLFIGFSWAGHGGATVKDQLNTLKCILQAFMLRRTKSKLMESGTLVLPPLTEITMFALFYDCLSWTRSSYLVICVRLCKVMKLNCFPVCDINIYRMVPLVPLQKSVYISILRKELPKLLALVSGTSNVQSLQNVVSNLHYNTT